MLISRASILDQSASPEFLFDSHCHLQFSEFDEDRDQVIKRAKDSGIKKILIPATNYQDALKAIEIANKYPDYIEVGVGNHPYEADQTTAEAVKKFEELITSNKCVTAIGETGLDNVNCQIPIDIQIESLTKHTLLAYNSNLPIIIHTRETDELVGVVLDLLAKQSIKKAVFHCFSGSLETAKQIWNRGYKTSFSGNLTYKSNLELLEVAKKCPPELLLLETDSPYLSPIPDRGQRNEPYKVNLIANYLWPNNQD